MSYQNRAYSGAVDDKIKQNQEQVKELTNIMHQNIERALQRDINLNVLNNNVENLEVNAGEFKTTSVKTKKWYIWKNRKYTLVLVIVVVVIILLIVLAIGLGVGLARN